jgi:hypothetical protein
MSKVNKAQTRCVLTVLEADRERDTGGELTMELRLSGTSTNGTPREEVSDVLGRDGVEKLGSDRNADVGEITQKLTSKTETLVDLEGTIKVWVIDETLPSDGCAGFFKVGPHDDEEVTPFGDLGFEELSIIDRLLRRVDRAGANDDDKSIVVSGQNSSGIVTSGGDGLLGGSTRHDLVAQKCGLNERVITNDTTILNVAFKPSCATRDRDTGGGSRRRHDFGNR